MKSLRHPQSTSFARLACLIVCCALFAPCLPLDFKMAEAASALLPVPLDPAPPGLDLPDLNQVRLLGPVVAGSANIDINTSAFIDNSAVTTGNSGDTGATPAKVATPTSPTGYFQDVIWSDPYYTQIEIMKQRGITSGCTVMPNKYCPEAGVTRGQMSVFIIRALGEFNPPAPPTPSFNDVPTNHLFYIFIERMAALGITDGCGGGNFCPEALVTREQMAKFLERAAGRTISAAPFQRFTDVVPGSTFYNEIESFVLHGLERGMMDVIKRVSQADINNGCSKDGTKFCPQKVVTRAEMAGLMTVAFGWYDAYTATERVDQRNRTGTPGEDMFSRNYNWSLPLLSLEGRSGLDLGLSLTYNSLVWIQVGSSMIYNPDNGFPGAGFRLGFPVIHKKYSNPNVANVSAYLLVTPSGQRGELRRIGSTNDYESFDSSYLKLTEVDPNSLGLATTLNLWTPDGTKFTYVLKSNEFRCSEIKDRNGNYITVEYNSRGNITLITDTLGRTITFNYAPAPEKIPSLTSITQTWGGQTHTWASFDYTGNQTIQTAFGEMAVTGNFLGVHATIAELANSNIRVLKKVTLDDGMSYGFDYTIWGQVNKIRRVAPDGHELGYVFYDLPTTADFLQTTCPRYKERRDKAENWNGGAEAVTSFNLFALFGNLGETTLPDGTLYKEYFYTDGYRRGLHEKMEVYSAGVPSPVLKKKTEYTWTQDSGSTSYQINPRMEQTRVTDDVTGNVRKTTISYGSFGLPSDIREYATNETTVLRRTHIDYYLDFASSRRIIGLPSARFVYDGETLPPADPAPLVSKVEYFYDDSTLIEATTSAATRHDGTNYGISFVAGRGNLCKVRRYDVDFPTDTTKAVNFKTAYNTTGSVIYTEDPLGHRVSIGYADSFSDGVNRNTFAYPTTVTDADNYSSTTKYNFDHGGVTRSVDQKGATQDMTYDAAGRVTRVDKLNVEGTTSSYVRWVYPNSHKYATSFTKVNSTDTVELFSIQVFDGAGRVRATASDFPGSTGLYRGQYIKYDNMGRAVEQSNPTEMQNEWKNAGDEQATGWLYVTQSYDWKGRPKRTTNTDNTFKEINYEGCGCAGGETVTVTDERDRKQKMYTDVLGREVKIEAYNWDGQTVYSTRTNTYNARDQVTSIFVRQGTSGTGQQTLMTYDGHGRLKSRKLPVQSGPTTYEYNSDDTLKKATDPRGQDEPNPLAKGARTYYSYNGRHLVTKICYNKPGSTNCEQGQQGPEQQNPDQITAIPIAPNVDFQYDAAGNRTQMLETFNGAFYGQADYVYDTWSRLKEDKRKFADFTTTFILKYEYNLAGMLTKFTDHFNAMVNYTYDKAGQMTAVAGSGYAGVSQYASAITYRAWGGLKHETYGNGHTLDLSYNSRLLMSQYNLSEFTGINIEYYNDGRAKFVGQLNNVQFDRAYSYDQVGRLTQGLSGREARGQTPDPKDPDPYKQSYQYDVWGNLTNRANTFWGREFNPHTATYVNDRNTNPLWQYDEAGNIKQNEGGSYTYNAAGEKVDTVSVEGTITQSYDGDHQPLKRVEVRPNHSSTIYYLRSSVLGGEVVTELNSQGQKRLGNVYAGGARLAKQQNNQVYWVSEDPVTGSVVETEQNGFINSSLDLDPLGGYIGSSDPYVKNPNPDYSSLIGDRPSHTSDADPFDPGSGCTLDGVPIDCNSAMGMVSNGGAAVAPLQSVKARMLGGQMVLQYFMAFADGYAGYLPVGAVYDSDGRYYYPIELPDGRTVREYGPRIGRVSGISSWITSAGFIPGRITAASHPASSVAGSQTSSSTLPCNNWEEQERDMKSIAKGINGQFYVNPKDNISYIVGVTKSHNEVVGMFDKLNLPDPLPAHYGGADRKALVNNRWYHLTVGYGYRPEDVLKRYLLGDSVIARDYIRDNTKPPSWITIHCEDNEPGTLRHTYRDYLRPRLEPLGRGLVRPWRF
jgi:YD repeat-containing protein